MMRPIPQSKWVWCGYAGHFIGSANCRFHLCTRIGNYRISTVGDYRPKGGYGDMESIGSGDRCFETYVFVVSGHGLHGEGDVDDFNEIDSDGLGRDAAETGDPEEMHFAMCKKYARIAGGLEVPA